MLVCSCACARRVALRWAARLWAGAHLPDGLADAWRAVGVGAQHNQLVLLRALHHAAPPAARAAGALPLRRCEDEVGDVGTLGPI